MMKDKGLVVLSGGQDSVTCLFWAIDRYGVENVSALTVDYGQRHARELQAASAIAAMAGIAPRHVIIAVPQILQSTSPLTSARALETYGSPEQMAEVIGDRIELTFVPMRNPFFLTLAMNRAVAEGCAEIVTGVCQEDNANYPDCRQSFIDAFRAMTGEALGIPAPLIQTPLMNFSKADTVRLAMRLPGCYVALAHSHTAYSGEYPPVTQDHATVLRASGFRDAGVPDPLIARAFYEGLIPHLPDEDHYRVANGARSVEELRQLLDAA